MQCVVGADVYDRRWVFVRLVNGAFESAAIYERFADGVAASRDGTVIGVDIPIGYPAPPARLREADAQARAMLGPRWNTVFLTLHPDVLLKPDQPSANAKSLILTGKGVGSTAFALRNKMLEVVPIAAEDPRIYEVHPEVSFEALADPRRPLNRKRSWDGHLARCSLLAEAGIVIPDDLGHAGTAGADDILDAAVAAWSASRIAAGNAISLPDPPQFDTNGRQVAIWY